MKHLLLLCLVALLGWSCKRSVDPNGNDLVDQNEIQISASSAVSLDKVDKAGKASNNEVADKFNENSSIGLYTQLIPKVGTDEVTNKANARFNYSTPNWAPNAPADRLRYEDDNSDKIAVCGYFPHSDKNPSLVPQATTGVFEFSLAQDQSTSEAVNNSNLMWCRADNNGAGYARQSAPISMVFTHLMCRVSISVRVIDSKPPTDGSNGASYVHLRSITLRPNPNLQTDGQIGVKAEFNALANELTGGALLTTTEVGTITWTDGDIAPMKIGLGSNSSDPATFVTDLLLLPFTAEENENELRFILDYPEFNSNGHAFSVKIPKYTGAAVPPADPTGNGWRFGRNDHVKITVTIDISSSIVGIQATVSPWLTGDENKLDGEPS